MADVKWIKLSVDIFDNRKIKQIEQMPEGDSLIVIWLKLLVLAGSTNDQGLVYFTREIPYTEQLLSNEFHRPLPIIQLALRTFQQFHMIEIVEDLIHISNWEKYQNIEGMDKIREQTRKRVANYREKQKLLGNATSNVTVTQGNATDIDIDKDKELDIDKESTVRKRTRFTPPTVDEVRAYCSEHGYRVDAERFVAYYESNGWRVGRNPMKDWRAAVRTWTRNGYSQGGGVTSGGDSKPAEEDIFAGFSAEDIAEIERLANDGEHYG